MIPFDQVNLSSPQDWLNPWGLTRIKGVAGGKPGNFIDKFGNEVEITQQHCQAMSGQDCSPGRRPSVHIGHPNTTFQGEQPRLGSIEAIYFDGEYIRFDYVNVPVWNAMDFMESGRFPQRSMEMYRKDDGWVVTAVAHLGSSWPGIEGMPPITPDMVEWMDPAAHEEPMVEMSSGHNSSELIWLSSPELAAKEIAMPEVTQAQLEAMQKQIEALSQETKTALAAKDTELQAVKAQNTALSGELNTIKAQATSIQFASAQNQAVQLSNGLLSARKVTPAMADPQKGNLSGIMLHAMLSCPPMTGADGKETPFHEVLGNLLSMQPSLVPVSNNFAPNTAPPAYQGLSAFLPDEDESEKEHLSEVEALQKENPKLSTMEALSVIARGGGQNVG